MSRQLRLNVELGILFSILIITLAGYARPARAAFGATGSSPAALHSLPPAVLVRLKPGVGSPSRYAPADRVLAEAQQADLRAGHTRAARDGFASTAGVAELTRVVETLGLSALPDLGRRAAQDGAVALVAPYADVARPGDRLGRSYRIVFDPGVNAAAVARDLAAALEVEEAFVEPIGHLLSMPVGARRPALPAATEGWPPNDPLFATLAQWGLRNNGHGPFGGMSGNDIRAASAWGVTTGNSSTLIGIVDTGVDPNHPELDRILPDGSHRLSTYPGFSTGANQDSADSLGHGTMVAGIAAAITNNGPQLDGRGVAGVCGGNGGDSVGCRIVSERVTLGGFNEAYLSDLVSGIKKAVNVGARVINVSLAFTIPDPYQAIDLTDAVSWAATHGATVVCGAGNTGDATWQYPGALAQFGNGVSVAAISPDATMPVWSTRGPQIDVVAPGDNIWSTWLTYENHYGVTDRNFQYASGTSFAAPFVTGTAGLAVSLQPSLTDNEFQYFLRTTAHDLGDPGRDDTFGYGRVDAYGVMAALGDRQFVRGVANAQTWSYVGRDTVTFVGTRILRNGCVIEGTRIVDKYEVRAHVDLPYLSYEGPYVIVRTHATVGYPNSKLLGFDLGGGEMVPGSLTNQSFDVRTWVYDLLDAPGYCSNQSPQGFVPAAPADVQIAWSALAVMDTTVAWAPGGLDTIPWNPNLPEFAAKRAISPNPSGGPVTFRFTLPAAGSAGAGARLEIYDIAGRQVRAITISRTIAGERELVWDLSDANGRRVHDGVYLARVRSGGKLSDAVRVAVIGR